MAKHVPQSHLDQDFVAAPLVETLIVSGAYFHQFASDVISAIDAWLRPRLPLRQRLLLLLPRSGGKGGANSDPIFGLAPGPKTRKRKKHAASTRG